MIEIESLTILEEINNILNDKGFSHSHIAMHLGISESIVKIELGSTNISLKYLENICNLAEISLIDLISRAETNASSIKNRSVIDYANII